MDLLMLSIYVTSVVISLTEICFGQILDLQPMALLGLISICTTGLSPIYVLSVRLYLPFEPIFLLFNTLTSITLFGISTVMFVYYDIATDNYFAVGLSFGLAICWSHYSLAR